MPDMTVSSVSFSCCNLYLPIDQKILDSLYVTLPNICFFKITPRPVSISCPVGRGGHVVVNVAVVDGVAWRAGWV